MTDPSVIVPDRETRLVRVIYSPAPRFTTEALGVLAPDLDGRQTLFVHSHQAQHGPLPWIVRVEDARTGQTIRVSGSWLGGDQQAAVNADL